ncbi:MAG: hypothetical protein WAO10_15825 [Candidatus Sulfotelmatobacter sp.]
MIVFWLPGRVMMLVCGVSRRMFPLLDLHMRDADWVGGALPPAACVLVAHSKHEGGIGGTEGGCTVRKFTTARWCLVLGWRGASSAAIKALF